MITTQKRRKKRQSHGLKTIELQRGKQGYGFTISGQQPCVIGNIISASPADDQGLREGDHLVTVNSLAVSQLSHEQVVRVIGSSSGTLKLQIADVSRVHGLHNHDSDSSDEQYVKPRYTHRSRSRSNSKTNHLPPELQLPKKSNTLSHLHQNTHVLSEKPTAQLSLPPRQDDSFPTIYNPMRPINGRASDFGVIRSVQHQEQRVGDYYRQGFNSHGQVVRGQQQLIRSSSVPDVSALDSQATGLSKILYPAMQPMTLSSSSTIDADNDQPSLRVIVGYIGSIEMPQDNNLPSSRLQSIRSAVRRLRVEQKVHTLVLLEIRSDGIKLINPMGATIVHYPVNRLAMSGMYPDDKRFFGLVTIQADEDNESGLSSACHVFMVDPEFAAHSVHAAKAKMFGIHCTIDPGTQRCIEFPKSCSPILRTAARLYKDKHGGIFDVPRQRHERPISSDSDTNSDSGLGFHKDQDETVPSADRPYVVDIHIPGAAADHCQLSPSHSGDRVVSPVGASGLQRSQTPIKASPVGLREDSAGGSIRENSGGINRRLQRSDLDLSAGVSMSALTAAASLPAPTAFSSVNSSSRSGEGRLTVHSGRLSAAPSQDVKVSTGISPAAVTHSPLDPNTVEQLRINMQRLLAKRKENMRDTQSLSDTESVMSDVRSRGSSGSRVSFNPHVAIATHNYHQLPGVSGGRSSGSESSSYSIRRRDITSQYSDQSVRPRVYQQQRSQPSLHQTPKGRQPPPLPPKPTMATQKALEEIQQHKHYLHQKQQEIAHRRQLQQQALNDHHETGRQQFMTMDDRLSSRAMTHYTNMSARTSDSLDSKLSPRAYPTNGPRQGVVATSEHSAFQRVSPESAQAYHDHHYFGFYNTNQNNNNNDGASQQPNNNTGDQHDKSKSTSAALMQPYVLAGMRNSMTGRPVPAPRPSRSNTDKALSHQSRSCSVPPNTRHMWLNAGRELNVDDGMSIRSESTQSLESQVKQSDHCLDTESNNTSGLSAPDKAVSIESLVEVGTRGHHHVNRNTLTLSSKAAAVNNNNNVGRVASWAVSFENLLEDEEGVAAFTGFLKKEYSEENIQFWLACEKFKAIRTLHERAECAKVIFQTHMSRIAPEPVNIDGHASKKAEEHLSQPTQTMFDEAQNQVFTLMKRDSYTRFIKSEFYQSYLVREFENDKSKDKVKGQTFENSDTDTQKRRTLPNFLKDISRTLTNTRPTDKSSRSAQYDSNSAVIHKSSSRSSDDSSLERARTTGASKSRKYDGSVSLTADLSTIKHRLDSGGGSQDESDDERLLRVVLPDGSTSVLQAKPSDSLRSLLATLLSKKSDLSIAAIDVFPLDSDKALDLSQRLSDMAFEELRVERRALFRLDLPHRKSVGVKAKPQRSIRDVLRPILHKYGYNIDDIIITLGADTISHDGLVSTIDNQRLTITHKEQYQEWGISARKTIMGTVNGWDDLVDFEQPSTTTHEASVTKKSKGAQLFGMLKNYSLDDGKNTLRKSKGKNVTFGPTKSMDDRFLGQQTKPNDQFLEMLTKAQSSRIDDQRGLSIDVGDLPEFLKSSSETDEGSTSPPCIRISRDGALDINLPMNSAQYSDKITSNPSDVSMSDEDEQRRALSDIQKDKLFVTPTKHNSSYHNAIGNDPFIDKTPDMNCTIQPSNRTIDDTLTPSGNKLPLSPLPTNLPPPPQFGNEAMTSTPNSGHPSNAPPPYREAISRSSLASSFNSTNSNSNNSGGISSSSQKQIRVQSLHQESTTLPSGNNPGNRLSYAHHNPIIFNDEEQIANQDDRSTPSPTTHLLVLTPDEKINDSSAADKSNYNFYEHQYKQRQNTVIHDADPVKVTFV